MEEITREELLYNNKIKFFTYNSELKNYNQREYIERLCYNSDMPLEEGDLPKGGALREVQLLHYSLSKTKGSIFPEGIEILDFHWGRVPTATTPLPTLPKSIHTVKNVRILEHDQIEANSPIPSNIKTILFDKCPNVSGSTDNDLKGFITIPNTLKDLEFPEYWNNDRIPFRQGDIPEGIERLASISYQFKDLPNNVLPLSLKSLKMSTEDQNCNFREDEHLTGLFDFISPNSNIEKLIIRAHHNIKCISNLNKCKSIKKLTINCFGQDISIESNSLPPNLSKLTVLNCNSKTFSLKSIPNGVTNLNIEFKSNHESDVCLLQVIPSTVTTLIINRLICLPTLTPNEEGEVNVEQTTTIAAITDSATTQSLPQPTQQVEEKKSKSKTPVFSISSLFGKKKTVHQNFMDLPLSNNQTNANNNNNNNNNNNTILPTIVLSLPSITNLQFKYCSSFPNSYSDENILKLVSILPSLSTLSLPFKIRDTFSEFTIPSTIKVEFK